MITNTLLLLGKGVLTIVICAIVYTQIDRQAFLSALQNIHYPSLLLAFLLFNLSRILGAWRIHRFITWHIQMRFWAHCKLYYVGMFYNLLLPGGISGDGYKALVYKQQFGMQYKQSIGILLIDRISGLFMLLFLLGLSMIFDSSPAIGKEIQSILHISSEIYLALLYSALIVTIIASTVFFRTIARTYRRIQWHTEGLSLLLQISQIASFMLILYSLGVEFTWVYISIFLLSSIVSVLPISFGGIGVRELVFLSVFAVLGLDAQYGVAAALLFFGITLLSALVGIFYQKQVS